MNENIEHIGFSVLHEAIRQARYNALKSVNAELVNLYWQVGAFVSKQLALSQWGDKTVQQLSDFLHNQDPALKGFDKRSIYRMIEFYEKYHSAAFVVPPEPQLQSANNQISEIVAPPEPQLEKEAESEIIAAMWRQINEENIRQTILAKISWTNHLLIFSRCKSEEEREFYLRMSIKEKYSKRELDRQISSGLFERTVIGNSNLSPSLRDIHPEVTNNFKDSYVFEFLNLPEPHSESDLQKGLIKQIKNFILELGKDFLFISEEYKVQVGNSDFYIDLLFYHRSLQCLVAFELKADKFKPEHLGQLNFYLEALDRDVKKQNENPSIGVLLCKDKDSEVVEYALSRSLSPTMVSEYKTHLPDKKLLQQKLHELFENNNEIE
ncbi:MAG: PDDEXK nuclease domain-containing protein [Ignavibacteriaceae bacterium]|nr:PDDEXK nuclease domain-containing protein [Ignavibacteriaceae bacterium]